MTTSQRRDHAIFDADLPGKAMSFADLGRILTWAKPHRGLATVSLALVLIASFLAILLPVIIARVVIDGILIEQPNSTLPDLGLIALTQSLSEISERSPLIIACLLYGVLTIVCHSAYHLHRVTLAKTVMYALRDLRQDLFHHIEYRPSTFFDKVAVGRIMTRVTNDVQALFEMLMGVGMLVGEFVPFFIALGLMLAIDVELTLFLISR